MTEVGLATAESVFVKDRLRIIRRVALDINGITCDSSAPFLSTGPFLARLQATQEEGVSA